MTESTDLISLVPADIQDRVRSGELELLAGQNPMKPVIRDATNGRLIAGSGRYPKANDPARVGKTTAYKHSRSYRAVIEDIWPAEADENRRGSLAWWAKEGMDAAAGSPQKIACPECGEQLVAFKKDGLLIFKILELLTGKARETQDINIQSESIVAILNDKTPVSELTVHSIDPKVANERRVILEQDDQ